MRREFRADRRRQIGRGPDHRRGRVFRRGRPAAAAATGADRLHRDFRRTGRSGGGRERAVRKLEAGRLVIASHNEGKVREIRDLLGPYGVEPVSAAELDLPDPDEIGTTFIDNADLKARAAADLAGLPALADDSGLCVEALGDRPGIFSARWALADPSVSPEAGPGEIGGDRDFGLA